MHVCVWAARSLNLYIFKKHLKGWYTSFVKNVSTYFTLSWRRLNHLFVSHSYNSNRFLCGYIILLPFILSYQLKLHVLSRFSHVQIFATPWAVASQALPSMGFSRQEYWSGLPFPSPGNLPNPGIKSWSPTLQADSFPSEPPGKPDVKFCQAKNCKFWVMIGAIWILQLELQGAGVCQVQQTKNERCHIASLHYWRHSNERCLIWRVICSKCVKTVFYTICGSMK